MIHTHSQIGRPLRALARSAACYFLPPNAETAEVPSRVFTDRMRKNEARRNRATAYFDGDAFAQLCNRIAQARHRIIIRMFIWKGDATGRALAGLLVKAADRGVVVDIRKDKLGDFFEWSHDFAGTQTEQDEVWRRFWNHPRIVVHHGNFHDHSKIFVIDDTVLIGTMNIGDNYCHSWKECFIELRGASFVANVLGETAAPSHGAISVLRSTKRFPMRRHICSLIEDATSSIILVASYFSDPECIDLLAEKSREGIPVCVVIPDHVLLHHHANLAAVTQLLQKGDEKRIRVFRHTEALLHAKILIVDMKTVCVGSTNFTSHSLSGMGEANVLFREEPRQCVDAIRTVVLRMIRRSEEAVVPLGKDFLHKSLGTLQL